MAEESPSTSTTIANLQREVAHLTAALGLLGAKPCASCGKFFLTANPANLFTTNSESVCYSDLTDWWKQRCQDLTVEQREAIEPALMRWLIAQHGAKVYRELKELPPEDTQEVRLIVSCHECAGSGTAAGERCRHCLGNQTVWVVTTR
jgi:hypothetical protein